MKGGKIEVTPEMLEKALRCCATVGPVADCQSCYLQQMNLVKEGHMSTGEHCFNALQLDAIDCIRKLNDFQNSQCATLLAENEGIKKALELMAKDFYDSSEDEVHTGLGGLVSDYIKWAEQDQQTQKQEEK